MRGHDWLLKTKTRGWMIHGVSFCLHTQRSLLCFVLSVEELSAKVEDGKDEIRTLKRKHVNNVKVRFLFLHTVNLVITKKKKFTGQEDQRSV